MEIFLKEYLHEKSLPTPSQKKEVEFARPWVTKVIIVGYWIVLYL